MFLTLASARVAELADALDFFNNIQFLENREVGWSRLESAQRKG